MADDSQVPIVVKRFPDGLFDAPVDDEDVTTVGTAMYISGDRLVKQIPAGAGATEAIVRKYLGYADVPFVNGQDGVIRIQTPYRRLVKRTANGTIGAGEFVRWQQGAGSVNGRVVGWEFATHNVAEIIGQAWHGADADEDIEIFER